MNNHLLYTTSKRYTPTNQALRVARPPFIFIVRRAPLRACPVDRAVVIDFIQVRLRLRHLIMTFSPSELDANDMTLATEVEDLEDPLKDCALGPPITELSDDGGDAAINSRGSSTAYYEQEAFETYQHKVAQLCRDIGYGAPAKIERMKGGGFNRVIGLTLESGQQRDYVLRIPRDPLEEVEMDNIKDQVAVLLYLSGYDFLHVPVVSAFDTTVNNILQCQYLLQERIHGVALGNVYYTLPLAQKLQIATAVAEIFLRFESVTLERPGRLARVGEMPDRSDIAPTSTKQIRIAGFRDNPIEDLPLMERQPLVSIITSLLEIRKQMNPEWELMVERCEKLQAIAREMEALGLMRNTDVDCGLWHWDLSSANVMIHQVITTQSPDIAETQVNEEVIYQSLHEDRVLTQNYKEVKQQSKPESPSTDSSSTRKWVVSGILDWDDVMSVPLVLARKPPVWLWIDEEKHGSLHECDLEAEAMPDLTEDELLIKARFDQTMAKGSSSYIDDAYHRGPWLRALAKFAINDLGQGVYWNQYDGFVKLWEEYRTTLAE